MGRVEEIKRTKDLRAYIEGRTGKTFNTNNKMLCPFHEDTDPSFSISSNGQLWNCFGSCSEGGDIIEFVKRFDKVDFKGALDLLDGGKPSSNGHSKKVDMTKAPDQPAPKTPTYPSVANFAGNRFLLPREVFSKHGCSEKFINGNLWMAIPTSDNIDRLRNLGGVGPKYKPERTGAKAQWFLLDEAVALATREHIGKNLVLCNGQTSTMVGHYYGVPAFCKTDGEQKIPQWLMPKLVNLLSDGWKLYIALDCDDHGKGHKIAGEIISQLYQFKPVFINFRGSGGYDLADHCMKHLHKSWDILPEYIAPMKVNLVEQSIIEIKQGLQAIGNAQAKQDKNPLPALVDEIESKLAIVKATYEVPESTRDPVAEAYESYLKAVENPQWITGLKTGITQQDYALGGLNEGIYTWLAETGMGKTTLLMSIAVNLLGQAPGFIEVGEASAKQIINRLVGHIARVPWGSLTKGRVKVKSGIEGKPDQLVKFTQEQQDRISTAYGKIKRLKDSGVLNLRDKHKQRHTISLENQLRQLVNEKGVQWAIIESTDNIPTPGANNEYQRISEAMFAFERMTTDHGIPVLTTSQAGRNLKGRNIKVPGVHDPLGSNHVEGKSFAMISIYNHWAQVANGEVVEQPEDEEVYPKGTANLHVKKSRADESGIRVTAHYKPGIGWYNLAKEK